MRRSACILIICAIKDIKRRHMEAHRPMKTNGKKNRLMLIIDAVGWPLGQSFFSPQTIIPMFIARLTQSNFLIGLVVGIQSVGQLVPQLFAANRIERLPHKKFYVVIVGLVFERLPFLVMALSILWIPKTAAVLAVFFVCWGIASLGSGINLPAFLGLFAKVMPENQRGRVSGIGNFLGTLLASGGAYVARIILIGSVHLEGYAWVFLIGFAVLTISVIPLVFIDELKEKRANFRQPFGRYIREVPGILRRNAGFPLYILLQITLQLALAGTAFITSYAFLNLGVSEGTVAFCSVILMAATAFGSLLFGILGDYRGYRLVYVLGTVAAVVLYSIMAFSPSLPVVYLVYALSGLFMSSYFVGGNMAMEYCPPHRAATYTAIVFTATAPFRILAPLLAGAVADSVGLAAVFGAIAVTSVLALCLVAFKVKDPRCG